MPLPIDKNCVFLKSCRRRRRTLHKYGRMHRLKFSRLDETLEESLDRRLRLERNPHAPSCVATELSGDGVRRRPSTTVIFLPALSPDHRITRPSFLMRSQHIPAKASLLPSQRQDARLRRSVKLLPRSGSSALSSRLWLPCQTCHELQPIVGSASAMHELMDTNSRVLTLTSRTSPHHCVHRTTDKSRA